MKYRKLGASDVEVSEISFGCWTMGGPNWRDGNPVGWADVNEDEVTDAIKLGLDAGVNHFDNADIYGNGRAERMLARVLKRLGVDSTRLVVATKVGHFWGTAEHGFEPAHIRHQCEQSLVNLQRDYIDLYYFHHGDFGEGAKYLDGAAEVMDKLVKDGKVRLKGQSAYNVADFEQAVPVVKPVVLQSWAHALDDQFVRPGSPLQKLMDAHDLSYVAFSPLAQGLLLDKFSSKNPPKFEEGDNRRGKDGFNPQDIAKLEPKLARLKERFGGTTEDLARMALQYVLAQPRVCCVIPGFRNPRQAACNVAGMDKPLTEEDVKFIRDALAG